MLRSKHEQATGKAVAGRLALRINNLNGGLQPCLNLYHLVHLVKHF